MTGGLLFRDFFVVSVLWEKLESHPWQSDYALIVMEEETLNNTFYYLLHFDTVNLRLWLNRTNN